MKNIKLSIFLLAIFIPSLAFAEDTVETSHQVNLKQKADGSYEASAHTEEVDKKGTKIIEDTHEERAVLSDGTVKETVKTETTADPKGVLNKEIVIKKTSTQLDPSGLSNQQINDVSIDSSGTKQDRSVTTTQKIAGDGSVETEVNEKVVTDPKGLLNRKVADSKTVIIEHPDGRTTIKNKGE